jgi:hypothetical protein
MLDVPVPIDTGVTTGTVIGRICGVTDIGKIGLVIGAGVVVGALTVGTVGFVAGVIDVSPIGIVGTTTGIVGVTTGIVGVTGEGGVVDVGVLGVGIDPVAKGTISIPFNNACPVSNSNCSIKNQKPGGPPIADVIVSFDSTVY